MILGKQVALIGGTGFVGRAVLNELSKAGYHITVFVRRPERHRDLLLFKNTRLAQCGNLKDDTTLGRHFKECDILINLTADLSTDTESVPHDEMVAVTQSLKKAIETSPIKRVITLSQIGANPSQTEDVWLQTLGEMEAIMHTLAKADHTTMQAGLLIGEHDDTTTRYQLQLKLLPMLPVPYGKNTVQPLWVKDFAKALVNALTLPATYGQKIAVAGEERLTLVQLAETVAELMGKDDAIVYPMCDFMARFMAKLGKASPIRSVTPSQVLRLKQDLITDTDFSTTFGFEPVCLEHALSTYIVPHSLRARYNFLRREAGRDASDLALLDLENPIKVP
jgi:NADH dehydrogenase